MISGDGLEKYTSQEDTFEVAIQAIFSVTGVNMEKTAFHNVHRHGRNSERIFAEYV